MLHWQDVNLGPASFPTPKLKNITRFGKMVKYEPKRLDHWG